MVPSVESLLEDTVSQWIGHDVEEVLEGRDRPMRAAAPIPTGAGMTGDSADETPGHAAAMNRPADAAPAAPVAPAEDHNGHAEHDSGHDRAHEGRTRRLWPMRFAPRDALPGGVALPGTPGAPGAPAAPRESIAAEPAPAPAPRPARRVHTYDPVRTRREPHVGAGDADHPYPTGLHVEGPIPHLRVDRVDSAGVRFGFDSIWLDDESFRASLPVRCAFSGNTAREKLIARPLVFLDRCQHARPSLEQITAVHENRQLGEHSPREVTRMMGQIEAMPRPFTYAVPYYVATRFAHLPLHCETRDRSSGGITCEVVIPDQLTALDWLARVNGVCGREYQQLEQDLSMRHGDAWQHLSEEARTRIGVWCKLGSREVLRHYFNDADFGKRDQGLAGLAVTDQRLVFCKYHHRGQVRLDTDDAAIVARCEPRFANLSLRVGSDLSRMIKLHRHDLDQLASALNSRGKITLQVGQ